MEEIFEIIFEFVFEIVGEGFLNLYKAFLPNKVISPTASSDNFGDIVFTFACRNSIATRVKWNERTRLGVCVRLRGIYNCCNRCVDNLGCEMIDTCNKNKLHICKRKEVPDLTLLFALYITFC